MARCRAVIDHRVAVHVLKERSDVGNTNFKFESSGNAIERFKALALNILAVLVKVNKTGGEYEPVGSNRASPGERFGGDARDFAIGDGNVAYGIESGFGVEYASANKDQVIRLRQERRRKHE